MLAAPIAPFRPMSITLVEDGHRDMSRNEERASFDDRIRISLLEGDTDRMERAMKDLSDRLTAEMRDLAKTVDEGNKACEKRDGATRRVLTTLLIAIALSSVSIVVTVLVATAGGPT